METRDEMLGAIVTELRGIRNELRILNNDRGATEFDQLPPEQKVFVEASLKIKQEDDEKERRKNELDSSVFIDELIARMKGAVEEDTEPLSTEPLS